MHKSRVPQASIPECKLKQLNHMPYSPDMDPSDHYLFLYFKSHMREMKLRDDDELNAWFEDQR